MKRRKFLIGAGSLVATSAAAIGTGAFSSVSADRSVSVNTADDDSAFLQLEPIADNGKLRSVESGSKVYLQIPGSGPNESGAKGVAVDSVHEFHDLIKVTNQGTQSVKLYSRYAGSNLRDLALVTDGGVLRGDPPTLGVGESIDVGLYIDTHESALDEFDETLTIVADQPDE